MQPSRSRPSLLVLLTLSAVLQALPPAGAVDIVTGCLKPGEDVPIHTDVTDHCYALPPPPPLPDPNDPYAWFPEFLKWSHDLPAYVCANLEAWPPVDVSGKCGPSLPIGVLP